MSKVLVVCDEYVYHLNGVYYFREFGNTLVSRYLDVFDEVCFAVRSKNVFAENQLKLYNIPVDNIRIKIAPIPFFQGPFQYLKNFTVVQKILSSSMKGCDTAIFRLPSTVAFAGLSKWRKTKKPYALEIVANPREISINSKSILTKIFMYLMHIQQFKACKKADGVSYVTQHFLQELYPPKKEGHFTSFYSSVELAESFYLSPRTHPYHAQFNICHVANTIKTHSKGHSTVIKVVHYLVNKGFDVRANFAGEGKLIPYFIKEAQELGVEDRINFVGFLDKNGLKNFLYSSDIMLFPTKSEGLPRVLIEAMATGLPCLSTPVGGIPELIPRDLLFDHDDSEGFANMIIQLINNPLLYEKLSKNLFDKSKEYSSTLLHNRRFKFYSKLKDKIVK